MTKRVKVGSVGIDSGTLILIDPCYIKYIKDIHTDDQKTWNNFCKDVLFPMHQNQTDHNGVNDVQDGIVFSNRIGDGYFPVYATYDNEGEIKKLEVVF